MFQPNIHYASAKNQYKTNEHSSHDNKIKLKTDVMHEGLGYTKIGNLNRKR